MARAVEVQIRAMRVEDRAEVLGLLEELIKHEAGLDPMISPFSEDRVSAGSEAPNYLAYCEKHVTSGGGELAVAELGREVVGFMCWVITEDGPFVRNELRGVGEVIFVVVSQRHRGFGIGTSLMNYAEKLTRDAGLKRLSLMVMSGNRQAVGAYEKLGYKSRAFKMLKKTD